MGEQKLGLSARNFYKLMFCVIMLLVICAWGYFFDIAMKVWDNQPDKLPQFGVFGDSFGVINSLVSCLAMLGVMFTIYKQHMDGMESEVRHNQAIAAQSTTTRISAIATLMEATKDDYKQTSLAFHFVRDILDLSKALVDRSVEGFDEKHQQLRALIQKSSAYFDFDKADEIVDFGVTFLGEVENSNKSMRRYNKADLEDAVAPSFNKFEERLKKEEEMLGFALFELRSSLGESRKQLRMILKESAEA
jgi:hypothetical protein